jgi:hypothetical protein
VRYFLPELGNPSILCRCGAAVEADGECAKCRARARWIRRKTGRPANRRTDKRRPGSKGTRDRATSRHTVNQNPSMPDNQLEEGGGSLWW